MIEPAISSTSDVYKTPASSLRVKNAANPISLLSFKGRLSVNGYMARTAFVYLAFVVAAAIGILVLLAFDINGESVDLVVLFLIIPIAWVTTTLVVKRLHDVNMTGWWVLTMGIPVIGVIFALYIGLLPGLRESNAYGEPAPTHDWENRAGIIGIVLSVIVTIGVVISEAISYFPG